MTTPLPVAGMTPYITPSLLTQFPTGVSWSSIPAGRDVTDAARLAAQANLCGTATAMADGHCGQPLRATIDPLMLYGPGPRVAADRGGCQPAKLITRRWPVLEVLSVQVSPNTFPLAWTTVPPGDYAPAYPVAGVYGSVAPGNAGEGSQTVLLKPGWVDWRRGREGYAIEMQHVNGWPHAGTTAAASEGATALQVDDCTGWAAVNPVSGFTGATGTVYDADNQEVIHVTAASAAQGPGTLTLAAPLVFAHPAGIMVSTLPQSAVWGVALFAASVALTRGATATTVHQIPGGSGSTEGPRTPPSLAAQARCLLDVYRRVI